MHPQLDEVEAAEKILAEKEFKAALSRNDIKRRTAIRPFKVGARFSVCAASVSEAESLVGIVHVRNLKRARGALVLAGVASVMAMVVTASPEGGLEFHAAVAANVVAWGQEDGATRFQRAWRQFYFRRALYSLFNTVWQEIWDPTYQMYYFHNSKTGESTWERPLALKYVKLEKIGGPPVRARRLSQGSAVSRANSDEKKIEDGDGGSDGDEGAATGGAGGDGPVKKRQARKSKRVAILDGPADAAAAPVLEDVPADAAAVGSPGSEKAKTESSGEGAALKKKSKPKFMQRITNALKLGGK